MLVFGILRLWCKMLPSVVTFQIDLYNSLITLNKTGIEGTGSTNYCEVVPWNSNVKKTQLMFAFLLFCGISSLKNY